MKRVSIAVMALVACLAIVLVPAATAQVKKKKFPATISLAVAVVEPTTGTAYTPSTPGSGTFSGQVTSGGPTICRSGRPVSILRNGVPVAQGTTGNTGAYTVTVGAKPPAGTYTSSVPKKKKKKKKNGVVVKKIICKGATSNAVPVA
jgi:hypothetical protein